MVANPIAAFFQEVCAPPTSSRRRGLQRGMQAYRPASTPALDALHRRRGRTPLLAEVYRERGARLHGRGLPTVVLGGFVPDATEALHCQRRLLRRFGDVYYVNYPRHGFDREALFAQLADLLGDVASRGERPVLFGISFGCGLLGEFLAAERLRAAESVAGLLLVSPVLSVEDLLGECERDATLVGRVCLPMLRAEEAGNVESSVRQGRRFFGKLFTAGSRNRRAMRRLRWRRQGEFLKQRILETVADISALGAQQRLALLRRSCPLRAGEWARPLLARPMLAVFAEQEGAVLARSAPVLGLLDGQLREVFPRGAAQVVRSADADDAVQHASLIFHSHAYNPAIAHFYDGLDEPVGSERARGWALVPGPWRRLGGAN